MHDCSFFGYGSLVNRETHDYADARPALLRGWRREWRTSRVFGRTFLSAVRDRDCAIHGLIARVPHGDWAALDAREAGYDRHVLEPRELELSAPLSVQVYAIPDARSFRPGSEYPIRLSYLDVVIAGFLREFGHEGVAHFFATTGNWTAIQDDRAAPLYARARPVAEQVRTMVDAWINEAGLVLLPSRTSA